MKTIKGYSTSLTLSLLLLASFKRSQGQEDFLTEYKYMNECLMSACPFLNPRTYSYRDIFGVSGRPQDTIGDIVINSMSCGGTYCLSDQALQKNFPRFEERQRLREAMLKQEKKLAEAMMQKRGK
ncbi:unnamed protein product [Cyprideis torosa]|uniref:Uncharacterized protein n=1 Tax=Cyprideis torosa TaxID=163714 RepID=A0A7R8ZP99_9CRUS|nr:unnamed protein product [Cyprideis torosa]CAG0900017.1 unnamed protein product [Cyprideis torosa]